MAKVSAGAAGSQLKRVGNYIAPQINKGADRVAANARQQKQLNATRRNQEDQQLEKRLSDTKVDDDTFLVTATGVTDEDDFNRLAAINGLNKAKEVFQKARELDLSGDRLGADEQRAKANKIQSSFKNLVNNIPIVKGIMAGYEEDFSKGKIKPEAYKRMAIGGAIRGEAVPNLNDNGDWELKILVRDEETGEVELGDDGKAKYVTSTIGDIKKGLNKPYYFNELLGKDGELNKVLLSMGKSKYDEVNDQYIDTKQVWDEARQRSLDSFIEGTLNNNREMYKWYNYATGEEKFEGFTDDDKILISAKIDKSVKGAYDTTESKKVAPRTAKQLELESARNRATTRRGQDLSDSGRKDRLALDWWKARNPNKTGKAKTETEMTMSRLHKDAEDFSSNSKPQVINGSKITIDKKDYTVYDTLEPKGADYVTVYMKDSKGRIKKQNVPKTKRGYLDFKLQSPEYKKYTADKVLSQEPITYQELTPQMASNVQASFDRNFKTEDGKFNGNDSEFIDEMKEVYNLSDSQADTTIGFFNLNTVKIGNTEIDLDDADSMLQVDKAIRKVKGLGNKSTEVPKKPSLSTGGFDPNAY